MVKVADYSYGEKIREWETGEIKGLEIKGFKDYTDKMVIIVDDIISYGGSIYYNLVELKKLGLTNYCLVVSHMEYNSFLDETKGKLNKMIKRDCAYYDVVNYVG